MVVEFGKFFIVILNFRFDFFDAKVSLELGLVK